MDIDIDTDRESSISWVYRYRLRSDLAPSGPSRTPIPLWIHHEVYRDHDDEVITSPK